MARRCSARAVKVNRLYTYQEAADVLDVTVQTIRSLRKQGLVVLSQKRPHCIMGSVLREFIEKRNVKAKHPLADDQVFCMTCKAPRRPYGMMADYSPTTDTSGRLESLCEVCEGRCIRTIRAADIARFRQKLDIVIGGSGCA